MYFRHAGDHLQFPDAIINAIESKHQKQDVDDRSLIVIFSGDYSFEEDDVIASWSRKIKSGTSRRAFREILLVERSRLKVFPVVCCGRRCRMF